MSVGARIRAARESRGWSRAELAERLGVTPQGVWLWEGGRRSPRRGHAAALEAALGISGLVPDESVRVALAVPVPVWDALAPLAEAQGVTRAALVGRILADVARSVGEVNKSDD